MQNATPTATQTLKLSIVGAATVAAAVGIGLIEPIAAVAGKLSNNHNEVMASTRR